MAAGIGYTVWSADMRSQEVLTSSKRKQRRTNVKKVWLIVALVALGGLAVNTFADVQNIRLSGDIRIRGYYLKNLESDATENQSDTTFISQRTRVSVEADLEDHVLVVVTLKAEGLWGANNATSESSGSGTSSSGNSDNKINRLWDVGITEAYVQFNEIFYTPATLKLGRQYLHYGHGLIISSVEQEYNYDAARLVLDYYPLTIDLVGAKIVEGSTFGPNGSHGGHDLLFINARYEMTDSIIKNVEGYFGWVTHADAPTGASGASSRVPATFGGASPWIVGIRTDLVPVENLKVWAEAAYEGGTDGTGGTGIEAYLFNSGAQYTFKDTQWTPAVNAGLTYASGGGSSSNRRNDFVPWFDYVDGYAGYIFAPALRNIVILNAGASVKPSENTTLSLQGYYYLKVDKDGAAGSNPLVDIAGGGWTDITSGNTSGRRELGLEVDGILGYDYSKDVHMQLVVAAFVPGGAFTKEGPFDRVAQEVRGEVNVKF
jgi:hypothetical protein